MAPMLCCIASALALDLDLVLTVDGEVHRLRALELVEGETTGLVTDGLWLEVALAQAEDDPLLVELRLHERRASLGGDRHSLRELARERVELALGVPWDSSLADGVSVGLLVAEGLGEEGLPSARLELEVGFEGEQGRWVLWPTPACVIWDSRLLCAQVDGDAIELRLAALERTRRGHRARPELEVRSQGPTVHVRPQDGHLLLDVHYVNLG